MSRGRKEEEAVRGSAELGARSEELPEPNNESGNRDKLDGRTEESDWEEDNKLGSPNEVELELLPDD
ncbi:MAG: hypothetical protein WDW20_00565 [Neisseriaceae bacterium]